MITDLRERLLTIEARLALVEDWRDWVRRRVRALVTTTWTLLQLAGIYIVVRWAAHQARRRGL